MTLEKKLYFLDFFAGSGLVSEGLKDCFTPIWANDICPKKANIFHANHPKEIFHLASIEDVRGDALPYAHLSWASFPCQDLSLAGNMEGILSKRSGLVWHWLRVMDEMSQKPPLLVAENVTGLVSAHGGQHYKRLHNALVQRGYKVGAVILDASLWVPQSRKRVFVIAVRNNVDTTGFEAAEPTMYHPQSLIKASESLKNRVWWSLPSISPKRKLLEDIVDNQHQYDTVLKTNKLFELIPESHRNKMEEALKRGRFVFPGYRRIRNGRQVLELRFDGIAGCLRTPQGGSSRQVLVIRDNGSFKTRLLTVKEAAALMGVRQNYRIVGTYNDGYKAMGDAVAVPVSRFLAKNLLFPIAQESAKFEGKRELNSRPR